MLNLELTSLSIFIVNLKKNLLIKSNKILKTNICMNENFLFYNKKSNKKYPKNTVNLQNTNKLILN